MTDASKVLEIVSTHSDCSLRDIAWALGWMYGEEADRAYGVRRRDTPRVHRALLSLAADGLVAQDGNRRWKLVKRG